MLNPDLRAMPARALTRLADALTTAREQPDDALTALGLPRARLNARYAGVCDELERRYHHGDDPVIRDWIHAQWTADTERVLALTQTVLTVDQIINASA